MLDFILIEIYWGYVFDGSFLAFLGNWTEG